MITQHLDGTDVKKASLVSPSWYVHLGESKQAMGKLVASPNLKLTLRDSKLSVKEVDVFLNTIRRYSSLVFKCDYEGHAEVMKKILIEYAPHLVNVSVEYVHPSFEFPSEIGFPKLLSVEFENVSSVQKCSGFIANDSLEKLVLNDVTPEAAELLKSAKRLKELTIQRGARFVLSDVSVLCNFKLTTLILSPDGYRSNKLLKGNAIKLLKSQASTLTSFGPISDMEVFEVVMSMPKMKNVKFIKTWLQNFDQVIGRISPNQNIEMARIGSSFPEQFPRLLSLLPNLQQLQISEIGSNNLRALAATSIRVVYYSSNFHRYDLSRVNNIQFVRLGFEQEPMD